ncbi:alginate lyase family protein [Methylosinus sp. PW1]|uniref:alginate lyase family protein n=1 Tax=Methylosinus sp. PW1 TaxID=107636 RepID=UPI00056074E1|nr:alginate lyase family protein [Methylosinus sp. PW1]
MNGAKAFARVSRAFHFGRHMPLGKLLRRLELNAKRALRDRASFDSKAGSVRRSVAPPLPLFAARIQLGPSGVDGFCFVFLNRSVAMPRTGIDWTAPGSGAEHQLWRMNLHYMEYLECVDDCSWVALVENWIASNPSGRSGAWRDSWNSYALSLRIVVWLQQLARRAACIGEAPREAIEASAAAQLRFLENNLEIDLGGNHLIKNIKALLWASAYFAGPEAARWRAKGLQLLEKELPAQILSDGMHYERSASYHCQVIADLLECRHALGADPLGGALDDALARMAQVVADLAHPDGHVALFNDAGLNMAYQPGECLDIFERMYSRRPVPRAVFALSWAGYFGFRSGDDLFVADCGRIAPDDLPAHGHGDVLSFEWSVAGKRIIVDQGVFEYIAGERRQASRSAANHNTLCPEGADQADFFAAFRCGRRPNVEVRCWEPGAEGFVLEGAHDGFAHLKGSPRHVRRFEVSSNEILIHDRVEGSTDRRARISFLLHPSVQAKKTAEGFELRREGVRVALVATFEFDAEAAVWWPDMGREQATLRMVGYVPQEENGGSVSLRVISRGDATE